MALLACLSPAGHAAPTQELSSLLERMQAQLDRTDFRAILDDPRYAANQTEAARLSIVCQILAYAELNSAAPSDYLRAHIAERAGFLVERFDVVRSGTAFDGMLALALMRAFIATEDSTYWTHAGLLIPKLMNLKGFKATLNWGLMTCMAMTQYYQLSGDETARLKALEIIASLRQYEHPDGAFPHVCPGSKDIHYTAFMGLELVVIGRMAPSPDIDGHLERIGTFMAGRLGPGGETIYVDVCASEPLCSSFYYGLATGCRQDYDTRGWSNEPAYSAVVFDHLGLEKYTDAMRFLSGLEGDGAFPDKWAYPPAPTDPIYLWGSADTSAIRTSVVFWSLATIAGAPADGGPAVAGARLPRMAPFAPEPDTDTEALAQAALARWQWSELDRLAILGIEPDTRLGVAAACRCEEKPPEPVVIEPPSLTLGSVSPNPGKPPLRVQLALTAPMSVKVDVYDLNGRWLRGLLSGTQPAGRRDLEWDGRTGGGHLLGPGLYFLRVESEKGLLWRKVLVI